MRKKSISLVSVGILCACLALPVAAQDGQSWGVFQGIYEAFSAWFGQFASETSEVTPNAGPYTAPGGFTEEENPLEATPMTVPGGVTAPGESPEATPYTPPGGLVSVETPEAGPGSMPGG